MNKLISQEAERHSRDMANHRIPFGHQYFSTRIKRIFDEIQQCRGGAENVAYNYRDAKIVVEQWLTSPGHRRNIEGRYNLTGIGLARDSRGKLYFTQIFVRTDNAAYLG
ncbi:CAP domain-containing protein [Legionella tunisiensis]|uniref:CAP domain-containing protein n=1 Tax=Legionella tunisiensis TaxID=1034944 RepID=UPI0012EADEA7|nr:CAP domain-containing protein [Legionella tunisiensis]